MWVSSHLFQRVASFLHDYYTNKLTLDVAHVLISFREWLHSYVVLKEFSIHCLIRFSSLSESGFIPTNDHECAIKEVVPEVLISFREWLHSYIEI